MNLSLRLRTGADHAISALVMLLVAGTTLAFGGAVWWGRPAVALLTTLLVLAWLFRLLLEGRWRLLKSPLTPLGVLALLLAVVQLTPLPGRLAARLSPRSRAVHVLGLLPDQALAEDPSLPLPDLDPGRTPITLDRPATLRWLVGASACLALFVVVAHYTDRLARAQLVWGSVLVGLFLNTALGLVQLLGGAGGLFGCLIPGQAPAWAPSLSDLTTVPAATLLRVAPEPGGAESAAWVLARPERPFLIGSLMGGARTYLALAALGLPLALGLTLQRLVPRESREGVWTHLRMSGQGGPVAFLYTLVLLSAGLVGLLAGPLGSLPFVAGLLLAGLPGVRATGLRWAAVVATAGVLVALGIGVGLGDRCEWPTDLGPPTTRQTWATMRQAWVDSLRIARDFPVLGTGLGSFAAVYPSYKSQDAALTSAPSGLLQWGIEAGGCGLALLGIGVLW
ncbi:MAG: O-antigen ligase family protein, partial [Isosphaeraceae bacterium]|nr:O-antigen ligase family protein [Isosphaeraceae bacterium]